MNARPDVSQDPLEALLIPIPGAEPMGENLDGTLDLQGLETACEWKPERQMGAEILPAGEPDWVEVVQRAGALGERTRDLRVGLRLAQGWLALEGFAGLARGLVLLEQLLLRYWDTVYPQLDPEDDYDPTMRCNVLAGLVDSDTTLAKLRDAELAAPRGFGRITLRAGLRVRGAAGVTPADADERAGFWQALASVAPETLAARGVEVQACLAATDALEAAFAARTRDAAEVRLDLGGLRQLLRQAELILGETLSRRGVVPATDADANGPDTTAIGAVGDTPGTGESPQAAGGAVSSRADVVRALDQIAAYYRRYEPSSPVPLLLRRARRWVELDFLGIMRDLNPDGLSSIEQILSDSGGADAEGD